MFNSSRIVTKIYATCAKGVSNYHMNHFASVDSFLIGCRDYPLLGCGFAQNSADAYTDRLTTVSFTNPPISCSYITDSAWKKPMTTRYSICGNFMNEAVSGYFGYRLMDVIFIKILQFLEMLMQWQKFAKIYKDVLLLILKGFLKNVLLLILKGVFKKCVGSVTTWVQSKGNILYVSSQI